MDAGANKFILALNRLQADINVLGEDEKIYFTQVAAAADMLKLKFEGLMVFEGDSVYKFEMNSLKI